MSLKTLGCTREPSASSFELARLSVWDLELQQPPGAMRKPWDQKAMHELGTIDNLDLHLKQNNAKQSLLPHNCYYYLKAFRSNRHLQGVLSKGEGPTLGRKNCSVWTLLRVRSVYAAVCRETDGISSCRHLSEGHSY